MTVTDARRAEFYDPTPVTCADCRSAIFADLYRLPKQNVCGHRLLCQPCMAKACRVPMEYITRHYDCRQCGRRTWYTIGWPHRYCTPECQRQKRNLQRRTGQWVARQRVCVTCGRQFLSGRQNAVTCSGACRQRAYRARGRR